MSILAIKNKIKDKIFTLTKGKVRFRGQITLDEFNDALNRMEKK